MYNWSPWKLLVSYRIEMQAILDSHVFAGGLLICPFGFHTMKSEFVQISCLDYCWLCRLNKGLKSVQLRAELTRYSIGLNHITCCVIFKQKSKMWLSLTTVTGQKNSVMLQLFFPLFYPRASVLQTTRYFYIFEDLGLRGITAWFEICLGFYLTLNHRVSYGFTLSFLCAAYQPDGTE